MKKVIILFSLLIILVGVFAFVYPKFRLARTQEMTQIQNKSCWETDLKEAVRRASLERKTLVLIFEGSDWCPACKQMQNTILNNEDFVKSVKNYFILYRVDFPSHITLSEEIQKLNQRLKNIYSIKAFPTFVLLDTNQRAIAKLEGVLSSPREMAEWMIQKIQRKSLDALSMQEMKALFHTKKNGHELCCEEVSAFCRGEEQLEKYLLLIEKEETASVNQLKFEIKQGDIHNIHKWNLHLALIDFVHLVKKGINPEEAVAPLISYLEEFGKKDLRHHWRLEMFIAFFLSHHEKHQVALHHARKAFNVAPHAMKKEITQEIIEIKKMIND